MTPLRHVFVYAPWLLWQLVVAVNRLTWDICTPGSTQRPRIVKLLMPGMTDLEVTMLTGSITITPGTLVLAVADETEDQPRACYVQALFCSDEAAVMGELEHMRYKVAAASRGAGAVPAELGGSR